jgi:hypothetical protein
MMTATGGAFEWGKAGRRWLLLGLRLDWSRAGEFGTVLTYADLPKLRAWRAGAQLDISGVFAVRKSEPALSVLFSELSAGQEAGAMPASGVRVRYVFTGDRQAAAGKQICGEAAVAEALIAFGHRCPSENDQG